MNFNTKKGEKMSLLKLALVLGMFVPGFAASAHEDHDHQPAVEAAPHGGILRNALPYKTELVLEKDNAVVYVYDKDVKPVLATRLAKVVKGKLAFPKEKTKREVAFNLKDGAYRAKLPGIDKVHRYDLHITITVDGKDVLADFGVDNIH